MEIIHEKEKFYFVIDGLESHLIYEMNDNVMEITHTYVPYSLRGKGIAGRLVEEALKFARDNNLKIKPYCSYVSVYINRHKEHQKLMV